MNLQSIKLRALLSIFVLFFCFCAVDAQKNTEKRLTTGDQYQIIGLLLNDKFKNSPEKTVYITTANLPEEIQQNFPPLKNKAVRLIAPDDARREEICAYEFGEFQFIDKFVSVAFGSCREGLAYDFIKEDDRWKPVSSTVTRELFY